MNFEPQTPEQEMREIFANTLSALSQMRDKVISTVVAHSATARELVELREEPERVELLRDAIPLHARFAGEMIRACRNRGFWLWLFII